MFPRRLLPSLGVVVCALEWCAAAEKPQRWLEIRTPHFVVLTNGNEKQARRAAEQFEQIRSVFKTIYPSWRVDPAEPPTILAAKDEDTMRTLLPGYWEKKGQVHPSGFFVRGLKNYVVIDLGSRESNPYHVVYHEYAHMVMHLNFRSLPVWLSEGLAEFFASAEIGGKEVIIGRPTLWQIRLLRTEDLLPLGALFSADHTSPYYNEENKSTIFYAQCWAVAGYLMVGDEGALAKILSAYLRHLQEGVEEPEARQRTFGDLKELEKKLETFLGQFTFPAVKLSAPADINEKEFPAREVSLAESATARGDFLLHTGRPVEARTLLEEALKADPNFAPAQESMGFMHFEKNEKPEAAQWFAQAVKLYSRNYLAHYFHATLLLQGPRTAETFQEVEGSLRRSIALNPNFAPAYATLAFSFASANRKNEEALSLARKAAELEPGNLHHWLNVASILAQMERVEEAKKIAQAVLGAARSLEDRNNALNLLSQVRQYEDHLKARKEAEEHERKEREEFERVMAEERKRRETLPPVEETAAPPVAQPTPAASGPPGWVAGKVVAVSCRGTTMDLTLRSVVRTVRLRAANFMKVDFFSTGGNIPEPFEPCKSLQGRQAAVSYRGVKGQGYEGEVTRVELRK